MWRLFWQYRHCRSDTWQKKQGDHPHGDLTELIVGPENGQLAVERDACVCGGKKVRQLSQKWKEKQLCKETSAEMGEACKVVKLKGHWECGATKLNRMGSAGFLWVTQESLYRESNSCMFVVWRIRAGGTKCLGNGLFVLEESLKEWKSPSSTTCYDCCFFFCKWILANLGCRLWKCSFELKK